jgi:hypothetical protein
MIFEVTEGRFLPRPINNHKSQINNHQSADSSRRPVKQPGPYGIYRFHLPGPVQKYGVAGARVPRFGLGGRGSGG